MTLLSKIVIPAKAGIQGIHLLRTKNWVDASVWLDTRQQDAQHSLAGVR
jgi:hypothetical protein